MRLGKQPSETKKPHTWRTRKDPFTDVWEEVKALFGELQHRHPDTFQPGQLRTLHWRSRSGEPRKARRRTYFLPRSLNRETEPNRTVRA